MAMSPSPAPPPPPRERALYPPHTNTNTHAHLPVCSADRFPVAIPVNMIANTRLAVLFALAVVAVFRSAFAVADESVLVLTQVIPSPCLSPCRSLFPPSVPSRPFSPVTQYPLIPRGQQHQHNSNSRTLTHLTRTLIHLTRTPIHLTGKLQGCR